MEKKGKHKCDVFFFFIFSFEIVLLWPAQRPVGSR